MKGICKRSCWPLLGCLLAVSLIVGLPATHAVGGDPAFVPAKDINDQTFEAIQDTETGLIWGKDINKPMIVYNVEAHITEWANGQGDWDPDHIDPEVLFKQTGGYPAYSEEHPDGWRPPTVTEVLVALQHGLANQIDLKYADGPQGVDDVVDSKTGRTYGDEYYWTGCMGRYKGLTFRFCIRYKDGDYVLSEEAYSVLAVRGAPPDHSLCPKGCLEAPNQGNKPPKGPKK
jgi:hypothetical protein